MDGKRAREIMKNIYDEDIDVEDKLTAIQDVICMSNLDGKNPCRKISKREMALCVRWLVEEYI